MNLDAKAFLAALDRVGPEMEVEADKELLARAERIAERARGNLPPGAMHDSIGVQVGDGFVDVGVLPSSRRTTESGAAVEDVAVPLEYGHLDHGVHVAPHPFMRPAIAAEVVEASPSEGA